MNNSPARILPGDHPVFTDITDPLTITNWRQWRMTFGKTDQPSFEDLTARLRCGFEVAPAHTSSTLRHSADAMTRVIYYLSWANGWWMPPSAFMKPGETFSARPAAQPDVRMLRRRLVQQAFRVLVDNVFAPVLRGDPQQLQAMMDVMNTRDALLHFLAVEELGGVSLVRNFGFGELSDHGHTARKFALALCRLSLGLTPDAPLPERNPLPALCGVQVIRVLDALGELFILIQGDNWYLINDKFLGELDRLAMRPDGSGARPTNLRAAVGRRRPAAIVLNSILEARQEWEDRR